jgi:hypothetical protein
MFITTMQLKTQFLFQLGLIESASCYWVNRWDHDQNFRLTQRLKYPIEGGHLRLGRNML